ncbi:hypothetical protein AB0M11_07045 [Streptomyces sp. NPDC051987]
MGVGINGTLAEFGNGLGVAVLGAVLSSAVASGKSLSAGLLRRAERNAA